MLGSQCLLELETNLCEDFTITERAPSRTFSRLKAVVADFNKKGAFSRAFSMIVKTSWNFVSSCGVYSEYCVQQQQHRPHHARPAQQRRPARIQGTQRGVTPLTAASINIDSSTRPPQPGEQGEAAVFSNEMLIAEKYLTKKNIFVTKCKTANSTTQQLGRRTAYDYLFLS